MGDAPPAPVMRARAQAALLADDTHAPTEATPRGDTPRHIAIIMDGNGRWARQRRLPRLAGHRQGMEALRHCVSACARRKVQVLTVFAFSSENWGRPPEEVSGLMRLLSHAVASEVRQLCRNGVRLHFIGERRGLGEKICASLAHAEQTTAHNSGLVLNVCFNYGGRWDIAQAARRLAERGQTITESSLAAALSLAHVGDPDLLIRTGGEMRISNFLLWQLAYCELFFSPCLWPAFDEAALDAAIAAYRTRERRFGQTSQQVQNPY